MTEEKDSHCCYGEKPRCNRGDVAILAEANRGCQMEIATSFSGRTRSGRRKRLAMTEKEDS